MSARGNNEARLRQECRRRGLAIGMVIFVPLGVVIPLATRNYGLMGSGVALALPLGVAFGERLYQREISRERTE